MMELHEIIEKRWQPENRADSSIYYGDLTADQIYRTARNDVLDLLDHIAALERQLADCQSATGLAVTAEECRVAATVLEADVGRWVGRGSSGADNFPVEMGLAKKLRLHADYLDNATR